MERKVLSIRILAFLFYGWLYKIQDFDLLSCVLGFLIVIAITIPNKKKSEAPTSDS